MRQFNAASCAWRALRRLILDPHLGKGPGISGKRSLQIKTHVAAIVARNTCNSSSSSSGGSSNNFRQPTTAFKCHSPKLQVKSALHERETTLKYYVPCSTLSCSHCYLIFLLIIFIIIRYNIRLIKSIYAREN